MSDSRQIFTTTDAINVIPTDRAYSVATSDAALHDVTHMGCDVLVPSTATVQGTCTRLQPGFDTNPLYTGQQQQQRKRATVTVPGPTWCVNKKYDPAGASGIILFNQCAQFSRTCVFSPNTDDNAVPDPDQCGVAHEVVMLIGD